MKRQLTELEESRLAICVTEDSYLEYTKNAKAKQEESKQPNE